jgi:hypothetical protein
MASKNQLALEAIITSGIYRLLIVEEEPEVLSSMLRRELGMEHKVISVALEAFPIIQNEERYGIT